MNEELKSTFRYIVEYEYEILKNTEITNKLAMLSLNSMTELLQKQYPDAGQKIVELNKQLEDENLKRREIVKQLYERMGTSIDQINDKTPINDIKRLLHMIKFHMKNNSIKMESIKENHYKMMKLMEWYVPQEDRQQQTEEMMASVKEMTDREYYVIHVKKPPVPKVKILDESIETHIYTDNPLKDTLQTIYSEPSNDDEPDEEEDLEREVESLYAPLEKITIDDKKMDDLDHAIEFVDWNYKSQDEHISMTIDYTMTEEEINPTETISKIYGRMDELVKERT